MFAGDVETSGTGGVTPAVPRALSAERKRNRGIQQRTKPRRIAG